MKQSAFIKYSVGEVGVGRFNLSKIFKGDRQLQKRLDNCAIL